MTVYRCWAIWGRNWFVVAAPILTLLATFGMTHDLLKETSTDAYRS